MAELQEQKQEKKQKEDQEQKILSMGGKAFLTYVKKQHPALSGDEFDQQIQTIYKKYKQQKMIDIDSTRRLC